MKEKDYYFAVKNNKDHYFSLKGTSSSNEEDARKIMSKYHLEEGDVIECLIYEAYSKLQDGKSYNTQENNRKANIKFAMYMRQTELCKYIIKDILNDRYYCKYCKKNISNDDIENYIGLSDHSLIERLKTCELRNYL